jgi:hypothetical protein
MKASPSRSTEVSTKKKSAMQKMTAMTGVYRVRRMRVFQFERRMR